MKPVAFLFCEGSDTKLVVTTRRNDGIIKILGISSTNIDDLPKSNQQILNLTQQIDEVIFEVSNDKTTNLDEQIITTKIDTLASILIQRKIKKLDFVPIITEPNLIYHFYEGDIYEEKLDNLETLQEEIHKSKSIIPQKGCLDFVEISDDRLLAVVVDGYLQCFDIIKSISKYIGKEHPRINVIKSAEISLAYFVSQVLKSFEKQLTLILYMGKEYSKLIFLKGNQIAHIGRTLDLGTNNVNTYDSIVPKILLEMETGNIPFVNEIIVCGEDQSDNLIDSLHKAFTSANIRKLTHTIFDTTNLNETEIANISSYSIPLAAALDYYDSLDKKYSGINLLPKYILQERKFFQFSWHSIAILPLLFLATVYSTKIILERSYEIELIDKLILEKRKIIEKNQQLLDQINLLEEKINNYSSIATELDTLSEGRGLLTNLSEKISKFAETRKNLWLTKITFTDKKNVEIEGFSISRNAITDFVNFIEGSTLKTIVNETIREKRVYAFNLNIDLSKQNLKNE